MMFLFNKILSISPYVELLVRRIYWKNISLFQKIKGIIKTEKKIKKTKPLDFNKIIRLLQKQGIESGSILVVHSSYESIEHSGLTPPQVIQRLLDFLGEQGTLAMPAIRKYSKKINNYLEDALINEITTYDTLKSKIWTGALPFYMLRDKRSVISRFPINSMVAIGNMAEVMMKDNLLGNKPTACGINSSWNFCVNNNAFVVGIGIDLIHSLTIIHVAEDLLDSKWPVKDWYHERKFKIIDRDYETIKVVKERRRKWGALYFAEKTLRKDLIREGILGSFTIERVKVEVVNSKKLINYLNKKNKLGYPYFWVSRKLNKNE